MIHDRAKLVAASCCAAVLLAGCGSDDDASDPLATVAAVNDTVQLEPGGTQSLVANDTLNSAAARTGSGGNVSFTLDVSALPPGVTVADGTLSVAVDAPPTTAALGYRICDVTVGTNCSDATVTLTVLRKVAGVLVAPDALATASQAAVTRAGSRSSTTVPR